MRFAPDDDQRALADAVAALLVKECEPAVVRAARRPRAPAGLRELWSDLAQMGVVGALAPERVGGSGLDWVTTVLILEEAGRVALPLPLLETVAVGVPALVGSGEGSDLLAAVIAGDIVVSAGLGDDRLVPGEGVADIVLLPSAGALAAYRAGEVEMAAVDSIDPARRLARVGVGVGGARPVPLAGLRLDAARDLAALAAAAELIGLAARLVEMTVDYVKGRTQFGVPVGSFQAVKHRLADVLLAVEFARPAVWFAAYATDAGLVEQGRAVSMAKAMASDAASLAARSCLQCHGAMGYTEEYDLQLWMKRAWALSTAHGNAAWHRARVGRELGL